MRGGSRLLHVAATGTLRYYQQSPSVTVIDKPISIDASETLAIDDVVVSFFGATAPSIGHIVLIPEGASMAMSSRTYTTVQATTQTFGTGVPTMTLYSNRDGDLFKKSSHLFIAR